MILLTDIKVKIQKLDPSLPTPSFVYFGDSGVDLYARINEILAPLEFKAIPTGIAIELPRGYEAQIRPRSGLALKAGISLVNTPGTIDSNYRGEIIVILINFGKEPFRIQKGDRICQMVICALPRTTFEVVEQLSPTQRDSKGFGSSGLR